MSAQHQEFADTAIELIREEGRPVVFVKQTQTGPAYDPIDTIVRYGAMAYQSSFKISEENDLVQSTDKKLLVGNELELDASMSVAEYSSDVHDLIPLGEIPNDFSAFDLDEKANSRLQHRLPRPSTTWF